MADFLFSSWSFFLCCFFFHYVSAKFHLWPSSGDLQRPRTGMLSLVTISPVITAFNSCLSHHVFDQVNLWPASIGFETAIFWQCSPGTVETQLLYPLRHESRKKYRDEDKKSAINKEINFQIKKPRLKMISIKDNYTFSPLLNIQLLGIYNVLFRF